MHMKGYTFLLTFSLSLRQIATEALLTSMNERVTLYYGKLFGGMREKHKFILL